MSKLTVEQVQHKTQVLSDALYALISAFEHETECSVFVIDLTHTKAMGDRIATVVSVDVDVNI